MMHFRYCWRYFLLAASRPNVAETPVNVNVLLLLFFSCELQVTERWSFSFLYQILKLIIVHVTISSLLHLLITAAGDFSPPVHNTALCSPGEVTQSQGGIITTLRNHRKFCFNYAGNCSAVQNHKTLFPQFNQYSNKLLWPIWEGPETRRGNTL